MKLLMTVLVLFTGAISNADGFTEDWYTSCTRIDYSSRGASVRIGDGMYSLKLTLPEDGISVFLGKDVRLADFIRREVLGERCTGLRQGVGTSVISNSKEPNPYSDIFNANQENKPALKTKALDLLIRVNEGRAQELLRTYQGK